VTDGIFAPGTSRQPALASCMSPIPINTGVINAARWTAARLSLGREEMVGKFMINTPIAKLYFPVDSGIRALLLRT
jgi:hypothetical protein